MAYCYSYSRLLYVACLYFLEHVITTFIKKHQNLTFRLIRFGILITLVTTFILASIQITSDYHNQVRIIDKQVSAILNAAKQPATRAVHTLDEPLANEVINGLGHYSYITEIQIEDETQKQLALFKRPATDASKLSQLLFDGEKSYQVDLLANSYRGNE